MSRLIILTTWEDIDGFKVIRREDTHQIVRSKDISIIKSLDSNLPMLPENPVYINLPDSIIPKDANAIGFLNFDLESGNSVQGAWYCKLSENFYDSGIEAYTLMSRKIFG